MNCFMTPRCPAGALLQAQGVIRATDEDGSATNLLEVAFEAKVGIAHGQHPGIDAAMCGMAGGAAFAQRLMFKYVRTTLGWMALQAVFILGEQGGAAAPHYKFSRSDSPQ